MPVAIHNLVHGNAEVQSYTPADVPDAVLVVCGAVSKATGQGISGATANGAAMAVAGIAANGAASEMSAGIFYLAAPGTAPLDLRILRGDTSGARPALVAFTLSGVDMAAPLGPVVSAVSGPGGTGDGGLAAALSGAAEGAAALSWFAQQDSAEDPVPTGEQAGILSDRVYLVDYRAGLSAVGAGGTAAHGWAPIKGARSAMLLAAFNASKAAPPEDMISVRLNSATGKLLRSDPVSRRGRVDVTGSYSGNPSGIEYRLYDEDMGAALAGHDWQNLVTAPAAGVFSGVIGDVAEGGGRGVSGSYRVDVRFAGDPAVAASSETFGVGPVLAQAGQSNMVRWGAAYESPPALNVLARLNASGALAAGSAPVGNGDIAFVNAFTGATGIPLTLIPRASSGTSIAQWEGADPGAPQPLYNQLRTYAQAGGAVGVIWNQGEADDLTGGAAYRTALSALGANLRRDTGRADFRLIVVPVLYSSSTAKDRDGLRQVREAQAAFAEDDAYNFSTSHSPDLTGEMIDGLHLSGAGYEIMGRRAGLACANILAGADVVDGGPEAVRAEAVSADVTDIVLTHRSGTGLRPAVGATGLAVSDDGFASLLAISDVTVVAADRVRLTHEPAGATRHVRYLAGAPDIAAPLMDDAGWPVVADYAGRATAPDAAALMPQSADLTLRARGVRLTASAALMAGRGRIPMIARGAGVSGGTGIGARRAVLSTRARGAAVYPAGAGLPRARRGRTFVPSREMRVLAVDAG